MGRQTDVSLPAERQGEGIQAARARGADKSRKVSINGT